MFLKFRFPLFSLLFTIHLSASPDKPNDIRWERAGGETTVFDQSAKAFSLSASNLSNSDRVKFLIGNSFFNKTWIAAPASANERDGLGPLFNARSCSECHFRSGRGHPPQPDENHLGLILELGIHGNSKHKTDQPEPVYGNQLQTQAILNATAEGNIEIVYEEIQGLHNDGVRYTLLKPSYNISNNNYGPVSGNTVISPRISPPVFGLGLLEAIGEATILKFSDPNDKNRDGISGRPSYVWDETTKTKQVGRFGWKADQPNIAHQVASAFNRDIGITSRLIPDENHTKTQDKQLNSFPNGGNPEISDDTFNDVVFYMQTLGVPAARSQSSPVIKHGRSLFNKAKCNQCHVPTMTTGIHSIPILSEQTIHAYTDLLLHDMGDGLAGNPTDLKATGREWRTPPLWGIGLIKIVNNHTRFLHDGRARNIEEAILWHDGEAKESKDRFKGFSQSERKALIAFVNSL